MHLMIGTSRLLFPALRLATYGMDLRLKQEALMKLLHVHTPSFAPSVASNLLFRPRSTLFVTG